MKAEKKNETTTCKAVCAKKKGKKRGGGGVWRWRWRRLACDLDEAEALPLMGLADLDPA